MKVINMFGGPGSGKTTTAAGLFYFMKLQHRTVELIPEYAKSLLWSNRLEDMQDQQEYIYAKQNHMLHRLRDKVDYAVVDSPTLLSYCYTSYSEVPWPARDAFKAFVIASFHTYDNLNIYIDRPDQYEETGRLQTREQAEELDETVRRSLVMLGIPYIVIKADDKIIENILTIIGE